MSRLFKLGATVSFGEHKANVPFPLTTLDYCRTAKQLKELEYDTMEIHIQKPDAIDGAKLKEYCLDLGIGISSIGTGQAYAAEGLSITSPDAAIREKAIQRLKEQMELGKMMEAPIIIGSMRGTIGRERSFDQVDRLMMDSMKALAEYAEKIGGSIVIEAINRFESDYLKKAEDVLELIDRIGSDRLMVHIDTYHMNLEESDWRKAILQCKGKIGHVHVADNTRNYPGSGLIDFRNILCYLREIGYDKSLTLECYPWPDGITALKRGRQYLCSLMDSLTCNEL